MTVKMTIKKKMAAGGIATALVVGTGFGLANTDAGGALKDWYKNLFGSASQQVAKDVADYGTKKLPGLWNQYENDKADLGRTIDAIGATDKNAINGEIEKAKQAHMNSVAGAEGEIMAGMDAQFDQLYNDGVNSINALKQQALNYAKSDLSKYADKKGNDAIGQLEQDIQASSDQAVADLQAAIDSSKDRIRNEVNTNKNATTDQLKGYIDAQIADAQAQISGLIQGHAEDQYAKITAAGDALEAEAIADLDAVVAGINN